MTWYSVKKSTGSTLPFTFTFTFYRMNPKQEKNWFFQAGRNVLNIHAKCFNTGSRKLVTGAGRNIKWKNQFIANHYTGY